MKKLLMIFSIVFCTIACNSSDNSANDSADSISKDYTDDNALNAPPGGYDTSSGTKKMDTTGTDTIQQKPM